MLVAKEKRQGGKGFRCVYDRPRTPYQRLLDEHVLTASRESALKAYRAGLSGMELYRRVLKRLRKVQRIQAAYDKAKRTGTGFPSIAPRPDLALRATPSGTSVLRRDGGRSSVPTRHLTPDEERTLSVQYLANQKPPSYLQSVFSI
jgi:hypothetical protein